MIPKLKPDLSWREISTLFKCNQEEDVTNFERAFAKLMDQRHGIFFPYGRTAQFVLLKALGIHGKEVICPAYTCVVVPHAIVIGGNEPVFVDCLSGSFNMNWEQVEEVTSEKTAVVIATSIFGHPIDLDEISIYRQKHPNIIILQDCAHSYSACWKGQAVQKEGCAAFYGSNISKLITSIFGGMITTDDDDLARRLREEQKARIKTPSFMHDFLKRLYLLVVWFSFFETIYGVTNFMEGYGLLNRFVRYYDEKKIDMPSDYLIGATPTQGRVGAIQCERFSEILTNRLKVAAYYNENLQGVGDLVLPLFEDGATYSHYVPQTKYRDAIMKHSLQRGVQIGQLIEYCIPEMPVYKDRPGCRLNYPVASRLARETINLPVSLGGSIEKASQVVSALKSFF